MSKKVVVVCGSPRKGGNAETLCDEFVRGCREAGHEAEKILLREKTIGFCQACYACRTNGTCIQQDDAAEVQRAMLEAEVIVLATPVYFYSMSGQMKTLIDRCIACGAGLSNKSFYFIATAADGKAEMARTIDALRGFTDCLPGASLDGVIYGDGAWKINDIQGHPAMQEAYEMGKAI